MIHMNVFAESRKKNTWFAILRSRNFAQISVFCWYSCLAPSNAHTHNQLGSMCMWHIVPHMHVHSYMHRTYILSNDYIICCFSYMSCEVQACACLKFRNILNEFWPMRKIHIHLHTETLFSHTLRQAYRHTNAHIQAQWNLWNICRRVNEKEQMMSETDRPIGPFARK